MSGVQQAVGSVGTVSAVPITVKDGKPDPLEPSGGAPALGNSVSPPPFDPTTIIEGNQPTAPNEVSLEERTADKGDIKVGQQIALATSTGVHPVTVVGIFKFAGSSAAPRRFLTFRDAQQWFERDGQVDEIDVRRPPACRRRSSRHRRPGTSGYTVRTGVEKAKQESADIGDFIDFLGSS